jgi:hypothetical protein
MQYKGQEINIISLLTIYKKYPLIITKFIYLFIVCSNQLDYLKYIHLWELFFKTFKYYERCIKQYKDKNQWNQREVYMILNYK